MYRILALICIQLILWETVKAAPKDSLRLEKRDGSTYIIHRVVKNESLATLAKRYGVSEAELLSANPLVTEKVYAGQLMKVPVSTARYGNVKAPEVKALTASRLPLAQTLPPPTKANAEPVQAPIAAAAVPAKKEVEKPKEIVKPSKEVYIPEPTVIDFDSNKTMLAYAKQELQPQPSGKSIATYKTYVVASPQSVQQVANTFSVEANDIIIANNLKNYKLKEGQKIKIPVYGPAPQVSPVLAAQLQTESKPVVKQEAKPKTKPESKSANTSKQVSQPPAKSAEPKVAASSNSMQGDSITRARKARAIARIAMLDSSYVHPDGATYVVFNYKQTDYQYDAYTLRMAEENAIDLEHTNQRAGYGGKDIIHAVKPGETLQSIARKYRISATDIINWNGLLTYRVREGQELVINSARADISPYQRTIISNAKIPEGAHLYEDVVKGLAFFDEEKMLPGVYVNGVEKGKFIYILNRDNYRETFARVLGPMPSGLPAGTVIYLGNQAARELRLDTESAHIEMWFGIFREDVAEENEEEAKAE
jgi:LysM repeat protein